MSQINFSIPINFKIPRFLQLSQQSSEEIVLHQQYKQPYSFSLYQSNGYFCTLMDFTARL
jgi:hypothetical protein